MCLFHADLAREIGLEPETGKREILGGIEGGRMTAFVHRIKMNIAGMDEMVDIEAGFTDAPAAFAILGQWGFFDAFRIKFERYRNTIEIDVF
jgi:hypothetical protein